jgi:hypothetical protein
MRLKPFEVLWKEYSFDYCRSSEPIMEIPHGNIKVNWFQCHAHRLIYLSIASREVRI